MTQTLTVDILLAIALVCLAVITKVMHSETSGHDAMGTGILLLLIGLIMVFFVGSFLAVGISNGAFAWTLVGRPIQALIAIATVILLGVGLVAAMDGRMTFWPRAWDVMPYAVVLFAGLALHGSTWLSLSLGRISLGILLAGMMLVGGATAMSATARNLAEQQAQIEKSAQEEEARSRARDQEAVAYEATLHHHNLAEVIPFTYANNQKVKEDANTRLGDWADLDRELMDLIRRDYRPAVYYVVAVDQKPIARFAPAWGQLLDYKLAEWQGHAAQSESESWDTTLSLYFMGAHRIMHDGGDLRAPLQRWAVFLAKCKGQVALVSEVDQILQ